MDKVILGQGVVLEDGLGVSRPNDNQIIIGGTGTGKSLSVLWPTMCHMRESSFIGTFAKGGEVDAAVQYFKDLGYKTRVWNLASPQKNDILPDPLSYIASDDDVQQTAKQIVAANPDYLRSTKFDPYWNDGSEGLLTGLIYMVFMTEDNPSMKKVLDLFYSLKIKEDGKGIKTSLDEHFDWLERKAPDSVAVRKLSAFRQLPYATAGCLRDSLEKVLQCMFPLSVQSAMSDEAYVDFEKFVAERTAVFIITSPVKTIQYSFANLIFSIAIRQLMEFADKQESHRLPRPVRLIFDDFSCGFPVQNYEKSLSTFRSVGISSLMLCQSLSQLSATYGEDNSTIILDNCSVMAYLPGGMNKKTCTFVSEMINLPLEEIMFMEMGNVVIFQSGKKPKIVPRYPTLNDPMYQKFLDAGKKQKRNRTRH